MIFFRSAFAGAELFIIIFALAFMIMLPLIIGGAIYYILRKNQKSQGIWQEFSGKSNLVMQNPSRLLITGVYNSCSIKLATGVRGSNDHREFFTYCTAEISHPLRFLLNISTPKGLVSKIFGSNQMILGETNFDQRFNVKCYDQNVLRRLLLSDFHSSATANLMGDLMLAGNSVGVVNINDTKVYVENGGIVSEIETLQRMIETATNLANRFKSARESFPLADWEKQTLAAWKELAAEDGLTLDEKRFTVFGDYRGFPLAVSLETERGKWQTKIVLRFPRSLMAGLKIMPENSVHKALTWFGVQDIEAGIKTFDDIFIVKAKNIGFAKNLLNPEFCRQMLNLKTQSSDFLMTDEEISLTFDTVLGDRNTLVSYLQEITNIAEIIRR